MYISGPMRRKKNKKKASKATPLQALMDSYCALRTLRSSQVYFTVDGERVGLEQTAEQLRLEHQDFIHIVWLPDTGYEDSDWGDLHHL